VPSRRATSFVRTSGATWLIRRWSLSPIWCASRSSGLEVGRVQQDLHFDKLKVIDEELVAEELSAIPDATVDPIWND